LGYEGNLITLCRKIVVLTYVNGETSFDNQPREEGWLEIEVNIEMMDISPGESIP
jgi:hypothetical protein